MSDTVQKQIRALIDRETLGLNSKTPDLFLDFIHPDMVWPWPPTPRDHDPIQWRFVLGRFNKERWRQYFRAIFDQYDLVHDERNIVKIEVSLEEDAAFAILDIDSLWRDKDTQQEIQWKGRVCKFYTRTTGGHWKFIFRQDHWIIREAILHNGLPRNPANESQSRHENIRRLRR